MKAMIRPAGMNSTFTKSSLKHCQNIVQISEWEILIESNDYPDLKDL